MATPADNIPGPGKTVAFRTIGCKLNQCETAQMQETLLAEGYRLVDWDSAADIRVVNTCTVTAKSDRTCRHEIRLAKRLDPEQHRGGHRLLRPDRPGGRGRHPRRGPGAGQPGQAAAGGTPGGRRRERPAGEPDGRRGAQPSRREHRPALSVSPYPEHPEFEGEFFSHFYGYTRAFLKVQTGCDSYCAYCIIPIARGPARSMPKADVLREVDLLAERGFREVVLTGINLGSWGRDTGEGTVADLLEALLGATRSGTRPRTPSRRGPPSAATG